MMAKEIFEFLLIVVMDQDSSDVSGRIVNIKEASVINSKFTESGAECTNWNSGFRGDIKVFETLVGGSVRPQLGVELDAVHVVDLRGI